MDLETLLNFYSRINSGEIDSNFDDTLEILAVLSSLTDSLHTNNVRIKFWEEYIEVLLLKFSFSAFSTLQLLKGTEVHYKDSINNYTDLSAIYILLRSLLENYLILFYLYFLSKSEDESILHYYIYQLAGLESRQEYKLISEEYLEKKEKENNEIEKLKNAIASNNYFLTLNEKEKRIILRYPRAKVFSWDHLISLSSLKTEIFSTYYKLFANYSHSEMISSIQLKEYYLKLDELKKSVHTSSLILNMIISVLVTDVVRRFAICESEYTNVKESTRYKIQMYVKLSCE